jgi:hypothetical protein
LKSFSEYLVNFYKTYLKAGIWASKSITKTIENHLRTNHCEPRKRSETSNENMLFQTFLYD